MSNTKEVPPVDAEKLRYCFLVGGAASDMRDPSFRFELKSVVLDEEVITITDNPLSRFAQAVRKQCDSTEEYMATTLRLIALMILIPEAPPSMVRRRGGHLEVHVSAFRLAASFPLNTGGWFDKDKFYEALKREAGK